MVVPFANHQPPKRGRFFCWFAKEQQLTALDFTDPREPDTGRPPLISVRSPRLTEVHGCANPEHDWGKTIRIEDKTECIDCFDERLERIYDAVIGRGVAPRVAAALAINEMAVTE